MRKESAISEANSDLVNIHVSEPKPQAKGKPSLVMARIRYLQQKQNLKNIENLFKSDKIAIDDNDNSLENYHNENLANIKVS